MLNARSRPAHAIRLWAYCAIAAVLGAALVGCGGAATAEKLASKDSGAAEHLSRKSASAPAQGECASARLPTPKGQQRVPTPKLRLNPSKSYVVTLATNCGTIDIELDVRRAPQTTASFAYLVKQGFYDDLTFHRVAAGFVIQGGDPNGDGSGGPGYTIVEPPPSNLRYTRGTVAMAKTGTDPAGASGSQFFIVTAREAPLPPQYALVGRVVGSMAGVNAISRLPTDPPQDGAPIDPVVISHASLSSR